jgi:hypothetical protein
VASDVLARRVSVADFRLGSVRYEG